MTNRIVVIGEDDAEVSTYLETALRCQGYLVKLARDGAEVMQHLANGGGDASLVMLDIMMPRQDGLETLRQIRRASLALPVIVFSGIASPSQVTEAIQSGATSFLAKPLAHAELLRAIRGAIREAPEGANGAPASTASEPFYSSNSAMQAIRSGLKRVAAADVPVVLRGESGVGKEVLARAIHTESPRANKPFLKLNCAAVPQELLESELFGYERGAFTGAVKSTPGKFETADGGTILLDEIGDMDFKLQAKLLHVLQDNEFQRLGGRETVRVNVRVLAATHCDLEQAIVEKRFREDLYYRLNVISIFVPPLRDRTDEILPLAEYFLRKHATPGTPIPELTDELRDALLSYKWPGNIRELENVMRKFLVFRDAGLISEDIRHREDAFAAVAAPAVPSAAASHVSALEAVNEAHRRDEARAILEALEATHWNRKKAAKLLSVDYKVLLYRMKKLSIGPGEQPAGERLLPTSTHVAPPARVRCAGA